MPNYTVCAYDLQGDIPKPGVNGSFTFDEAAMGAVHPLTVNDDDQWADSLSPDNENGANATYVSGSGEPSWNVGDPVDLNAVNQYSGSDGSTITMGWLNIASSGTGEHQMMTDAPLVDGVTYTEIPGSATSTPPASTYPWAQFDFSHPTPPPCFTRGMEIRTNRGPVAVENIQPGDMIWTLDNGYQEVKYITHRKHKAMGSNTPILFKKGAIGNAKDVIVSPKHRFHVASLPAHQSRHFGNLADGLLPAEAFCDGVNVRPYPEIGEVEYFHLMFDNHELLECYGTISESWQPTRAAIRRNPEIAEELLAIFPEMETRRAFHPGGMVRPEIAIRKKPAA